MGGMMHAFEDDRAALDGNASWQELAKDLLNTGDYRSDREEGFLRSMAKLPAEAKLTEKQQGWLYALSWRRIMNHQ
jgi:hypothetical protein